ncbi:MAG: hypothetical protein M0O99_08805 [Desulfuromonas thiophila]|jgi:hypothetical protein|nr:hypothetical protein [Desulfuromonas thiophila]
MKKNIILSLVFLAFATSSFAEVAGTAAQDLDLTSANTGLELRGGDETAGADTNSALIGRASTNVAVGWQTSTARYALITQHSNGTKAYGSATDSTAIFQTVGEGTPGTAVTDLTASDTSDFNDAEVWSKM